MRWTPEARQASRLTGRLHPGAALKGPDGSVDTSRELNGGSSIDEVRGRLWHPGGTSRPFDVSTPEGFARTWWHAVRAPWIAAISLAACALLGIQLLRLVLGAVEAPSTLTGLLMVFGPATVIATLPDTTVLWRVGALFIALHVGPLTYAPPDRLSFGGFLDSWGQTISDERGMQAMFLWGVLLLPAMEVLGAWWRRGKLVHEAVRRSRGTFTW